MTKIVQVEPGSIAEEGGIVPGDYLVSVNGEEINDILRFKYLTTDEEFELEIQKADGSIEVLEIYNEYGEDLGLTFEFPLMTKAKSCANKCIFCFIDQMPKGMRKSLYFKDDDSRLSFLQGNYVTLTNLSDKEIANIASMRMSPINISVQVTDPEKRKFMLGNKKADNLLPRMRIFKEAGIVMNCQVVLCKNINDGVYLDKTLSDLEELMPEVFSISVVPFGATKYREGLYPIELFSGEECGKVIQQVSKWQDKFLQKYGRRTVYLSDEFYLNAGVELPPYDAYEDFPQLENGVGMIRVTEDEFSDALLSIKKGTRKKVSVATGLLCETFLKSLIQRLPEHNCTVYGIENKFFGKTVTVSGLITGNDLIQALKDKDLGEALIIPSNMLRAETDVFLDDVTVPEAEQKLNCKILVSYNGYDLAEKIAGVKGDEQRNNRNGGFYETDSCNSW